jgi:hypothetical protein
MADKLALLKAQTQRYLTSHEAQSLKQALSRFTQEKVRSPSFQKCMLSSTLEL